MKKGSFFISILFLFSSYLHGEMVFEYARGIGADAVISHELPGEPIGLPYNHPSGVWPNKYGNLVICWSGGNAEGGSGTGINVLVQDDTGWSSVIRADNGPQGFDPQVYQPSDTTKPLYLYFHRGSSPPNWKGYVRTSTDGGYTWSEALKLPVVNDRHMVYNHQDPNGSGRWVNYWHKFGYRHVGPEQNPPLELPNGDLLMSASMQVYISMGNVGVYSHVVRIPANNYSGSEPGGDPWIDIKYIGEDSINAAPREAGVEPLCGAFLVLDNNVDDGSYDSLGLILRSDINGPILLSKSFDAGGSWSDPERIITVAEYGKDSSPHSGIAAWSIDYKGGSGKGWHIAAGAHAGRKHIRIIASKDLEKWLINVLDVRLYSTDDGAYPGSSGGIGEQADPTLIQTADRMIHLVWTGRSSASVRHIVIDPDILVEKLESAWPPQVP